jgi:hypothetical protein
LEGAVDVCTIGYFLPVMKSNAKALANYNRVTGTLFPFNNKSSPKLVISSQKNLKKHHMMVFYGAEDQRLLGLE